jgi:dynamin 1-like protein
MKKDGTLSYFRHMGDPEPAGVIYIPGCVVERADAMCGKRCSFQIYHPAGNIGKTFFFQLQNEVEANEWVQMLKEEAAKEPEEEGEEGEGGIANLLGAASGGEEGEDGFDAIPDGTRQRGLTMRIHAAIHENLGMREKVECEILFRLLHSYFEIVKKNIADQVPKAITLKMINKVKEELCARLLQEIDSEDKVKQLSSVSDEVKVKYEKTKGTLELLQDSQAILRDLSSSAV